MIAQINSAMLASANELALMADDPAWPASLLAQAMGDEEREVWGWFHAGQPGVPRAFCVLSVGPFDLEVEMIAVAKAHRRQGLAVALMEQAKSRVLLLDRERLLLEVRASNTAAQRLYATVGMAKDGVRKRYYPQPDGSREDAWLYSWQPENHMAE